jgi:hypothetical protein
MENLNYSFEKRGLVGLARTYPDENNAQSFDGGPELELFSKRSKVQIKIRRIDVDKTDKSISGKEAVIENCGE